MTETSSIISALGAGSGVDMAKLASQLAVAQFEQRTLRLTEQGETLERQISIAASIRNSISLLSSALGDRLRQGDLSPKPSVANGAVATASSPLGTTGQGVYSLEVLSLASAQTLSAPAVPDAQAPLGSGTLTFRFGNTTGSSFTEDASREAVMIDIPSGASLSAVASAINAKRAGITAYVAQTDQGAQLVLKGPEGAQSGFIIEASEAAGEPGLAALAWNPSTGGDPSRLIAGARNASFLLDGLAMSSATNQTGQIAPGLSLTLTGTNAGAPTQIGFANPAANITGAVQDIVGALNEIASELRIATDPMGGDLSRDPGARALKRAFSELAGTVIMPNAPPGAPRTLADLGVATERDGSFRLDTERLQATLTRDPAGAAAMFTTGLYGIYATIDGVARNASRTADPGSLAGSIARYEGLAKQVSEDTLDIAEKQETLRASLTARFAKTDARISASQATLSFLQQQVDAWNSQND